MKARQRHLNHSDSPWRPTTAHQLHLWRHLKDPSSVGDRQLTRQLAIAPENEMLYQGKEISWYVIWTIQSCHDALEHPWIHLKDPSIGNRQRAHRLPIVNWKWDVILRQHNVKVCHFNHSEKSWHPGTTCQLPFWRHLKDPLSMGTFPSQLRIAILCASCQPPIDNGSFKCL